MKKIVTLTAYPISAIKYSTEYGEKIRVSFTYEVHPTEKDKNFYHTEKPLKVLELVDSIDNFHEFVERKISKVELNGIFIDFKFALTDYKIIK